MLIYTKYWNEYINDQFEKAVYMSSSKYVSDLEMYVELEKKVVNPWKQKLDDFTHGVALMFRKKNS
jgi:hypothetical protein